MRGTSLKLAVAVGSALACLSQVRAAVLFQDTFDSPNNGDINADVAFAGRQSGSIGTQTYTTAQLFGANPPPVVVYSIAGGKLSGVAAGASGFGSVVNYNFGGNGFQVDVDMTPNTNAPDTNYFGAVDIVPTGPQFVNVASTMVGMAVRTNGGVQIFSYGTVISSSAEDPGAGNALRQGTPQVRIVISTPDGSNNQSAEFYVNGTQIGLDNTQSGVNAAGTTLTFAPGSFANSFVNLETFTSGTGGSVSYDNLMVSSVPEPAVLSVACLSSLALLRRRR